MRGINHSDDFSWSVAPRGGKGGGTSTTTQNNSPPPQFLAAYSDVMQRAQNAVNQPLQQYPGTPQSLITGFSPDQQAAMQEIEGAQNISQPYLNAAAQYMSQAGQPFQTQQFQDYLTQAAGPQVTNAAQTGAGNIYNAAQLGQGMVSGAGQQGVQGLLGAGATGSGNILSAGQQGAQGMLSAGATGAGGIMDAGNRGETNILGAARTGTAGILGAGASGAGGIQSAGMLGANQIGTAAQQALPEIYGASTSYTPGQISQWYSPYVQNVVDKTQAQFNNQNLQGQAALRGNTASQGALGGDRLGVAQGILVNQQQLAQAPVIAGLYNQGFMTAEQAALNQAQLRESGAVSAGQLGVGASEAQAQQELQAALGAGQLSLGAATSAGQLGVGAAENAGQLGLGAATNAGQLRYGAAQGAGQLGLGAAQGAGQLGLGAAQGAGQLGLGAATTGAQLGLSGAQGAGAMGLQGATTQAQLQNQAAQQLLGANEAQGWLNSGLGYGMANLGQEALNTSVTGANALMGVGGMQQQEAQQYLNIPYEQWVAQQSYPFQSVGWLGNLAEGLGSAAGGTSTGTSTAPGPSAVSQIAGLGATAAGIYGLGNQAGWWGGAGAGATGSISDAFNTVSSDVGAAASGAAGAYTGAAAAQVPFARRGGRIPHRALGGGGLDSPDMGTDPTLGLRKIDLPDTSMSPDVSLSIIPQGASPRHGTMDILKDYGKTSTTTGGGGGDSIFGSLLKTAGTVVAGIYGGPAGAAGAAALGSQIHFDKGGRIPRFADGGPPVAPPPPALANPGSSGGPGIPSVSVMPANYKGGIGVPQLSATPIGSGTGGGGTSGGSFSDYLNGVLGRIPTQAQLDATKPQPPPAPPTAATPTADPNAGMVNQGGGGGSSEGPSGIEGTSLGSNDLGGIGGNAGPGSAGEVGQGGGNDPTGGAGTWRGGVIGRGFASGGSPGAATVTVTPASYAGGIGVPQLSISGGGRGGGAAAPTPAASTSGGGGSFNNYLASTTGQSPTASQIAATAPRPFTPKPMSATSGMVQMGPNAWWSSPYLSASQGNGMPGFAARGGSVGRFAAGGDIGTDDVVDIGSVLQDLNAATPVKPALPVPPGGPKPQTMHGRETAPDPGWTWGDVGQGVMGWLNTPQDDTMPTAMRAQVPRVLPRSSAPTGFGRPLQNEGIGAGLVPLSGAAAPPPPSEPDAGYLTSRGELIPRDKPDAYAPAIEAGDWGLGKTPGPSEPDRPFTVMPPQPIGAGSVGGPKTTDGPPAQSKPPTIATTSTTEVKPLGGPQTYDAAKGEEFRQRLATLPTSKPFAGSVDDDAKALTDRVGSAKSALSSKGGTNFMTSPWMTLIAAGLGIMGGTSPYAGVNIGRGALAGLQFGEKQRETTATEELRAQQAKDLAEYRKVQGGVAQQRANTYDVATQAKISAQQFKLNNPKATLADIQQSALQTFQNTINPATGANYTPAEAYDHIKGMDWKWASLDETTQHHRSTEAASAASFNQRVQQALEGNAAKAAQQKLSADNNEMTNAARLAVADPKYLTDPQAAFEAAIARVRGARGGGSAKPSTSTQTQTNLRQPTADELAQAKAAVATKGHDAVAAYLTKNGIDASGL